MPHRRRSSSSSSGRLGELQRARAQSCADKRATGREQDRRARTRGLAQRETTDRRTAVTIAEYGVDRIDRQVSGGRAGQDRPCAPRFDARPADSPKLTPSATTIDPTTPWVPRLRRRRGAPRARQHRLGADAEHPLARPPAAPVRAGRERCGCSTRWRCRRERRCCWSRRTC